MTQSDVSFIAPNHKRNSSAIRICFVVSSLCNEGPVNVMYNIIQYIDFSKYEVSIITLIPEKKNSRIEDFKKFPLSIHPLAPKENIAPLTMFKALKKKILEINPHMLHAHCPRSLYLLCFLPRKFKRIYTIHIYPGLQQKILYGGLKGRIVIGLNNFFTRKIDLPIACAESVSELYRKKQGWSIMSIPNGCSLSVWEENSIQKSELRRKLGLQEDKKYFIYIGRFSAEKNPQLLIQAFSKLKNPDINLIMLGGGPMWETLKNEANERIILPGFKTNIKDYLIASDYYVSASDVEGLANTLLESMAIGLLPLLSDIPSHREVLSKMKQPVGFIFDNKDINDLENKINRMVNTIDKHTASQEIKSVFNDYYTAERMSLSYQSAYANLFTKNN